MKQVAGKLKLELAQFAELEAFSQFASDLDQATRNQLARGQRLREILKQAANSPIPVEEQVAIIYTGINGFLDDIEVSKVRSFVDTLRTNLRNSKPKYAKIGRAHVLNSSHITNSYAVFCLKKKNHVTPLPLKKKTARKKKQL